MGFKNLDNPGIFELDDPSLEDVALFAEMSIRRFKSDEGMPILTAGQLAFQTPRREESFIIRTVYDRFSQEFISPRSQNS